MSFRFAPLVALALTVACAIAVPAVAGAAEEAPAGAGSILKKDMDETTARDIMRSFNKALGVKCNYCHVKTGKKFDYEVWTPRKRIALRMHTDFVEKLKGEGGAAVTCNTCHQGRKKWLKQIGKGVATP